MATIESLIESCNELLTIISNPDEEVQRINDLKEVGSSIEETIKSFMQEKQKNISSLENFSRNYDAKIDELKTQEDVLHKRIEDIEKKESSNLQELIEKNRKKDFIFYEFCKNSSLKEDYALKDFETKKGLMKEIKRLQTKLNFYENCTSSTFLRDNKGNSNLLIYSSDNDDVLISHDQLMTLNKNDAFDELWEIRGNID